MALENKARSRRPRYLICWCVVVHLTWWARDPAILLPLFLVIGLTKFSGSLRLHLKLYSEESRWINMLLESFETVKDFVWKLRIHILVFDLLLSVIIFCHLYLHTPSHLKFLSLCIQLVLHTTELLFSPHSPTKINLCDLFPVYVLNHSTTTVSPFISIVSSLSLEYCPSHSLLSKSIHPWGLRKNYTGSGMTVFHTPFLNQTSVFKLLISFTAFLQVIYYTLK